MRKNTLLTFCLKAVLLLVILFGVDRLVGASFVMMKDVGLVKNPENMWLKSAFTLEQVDDEVVVIGSSKATHHYIPQMLEDSLHMTTYNCGQDGCFFLYQNCVVNMILDRYQPKVLIWDIQPESFTSGDNANQYQNIRYLTPYYDHNAWVRSYVDGESEKMKYRMVSRMFGYNSKFLNYVFPLLTHSSKTDKGYIPLPNGGYKHPELKHEKDNNLVGGVSLNYLALLEATLKRCKENKVSLYLFISPVYSVKSELTRSAETAIGKVAADNGFSCFNYHSSKAFLSDATLFKDMGHLNAKGAKLYTEMVIEDIMGS